MGETFQPPFTRRLAIVIGINQYQNGIAQLHTAAHDANVLAESLETDYDYQVWQFVDTDATLEKLTTLFSKALPKDLAPTDQDCLLIYFAGHGIARNSDETGPVGYLIPQDAKPEDESTFLPMQTVIQALNDLDCRHMLLIADCCFAGAFRWASSRDIGIVPGTVHKQRYDRFIKSPAWQVLTSAAYDQKAIDLVRDNRVVSNAEGVHSPFAEALLAALRGAGDLNGDQLVTATELYLYLRDHVETSSDNEQTPGIWPLQKHEYGEYLFLSKAFDKANLENAPPLDAANNPYRGLKAYETRHAHLFFGRDALIKSLYQEHVANNPLTVVLGASGTGKSSLVKAGLVSYLKNQAVLVNRKAFKDPNDRVQEDWQILPPMRPGTEPLRSLAEALMPICTEAPSPQALAAVDAFDDTREGLPEEFRRGWQTQTTPQARLSLVLEWNKVIEDRLWPSGTAKGEDYEQFQQLQNLAIGYLKHLRGTLKKGFKYLVKLVSGWFEAYPDSRFLLVVDQAEELITQAHNEAERQQFLTYLDEALRAFPDRLRCVMTLRLDFEDMVRQQMPQRLEALWPQAQFVVSPMGHGELQEAIEGPAAEKVLYFEEGLVNTIIKDVMQMPGALALLSFTLSELYQKCFERFRQGEQDRELTKADYQALGGVIGSLRQRANEEYRAFDLQERQTLKKIMLRMVAAEGGELARRRVPRTELVYAEADENQRVETILTQLVERRLLVSGKSAEGEYVEPAHDALVRSWEQIPQWLNETTRVIPEPTRWQKLRSLLGGRNRQSNKKEGSELQLKFNLPLQREVTGAAERWLPAKCQKEGWDLLWTRDPRLDQLKQVQVQGRWEDNWLNWREGEFVDSSLQRKNTLARRWRWGTSCVSGVIALLGVIAIIMGIRAVAQARAAQRQTVRAMNQAASTHLASDNYFDALLEATRAGSLIQQNSHLAHDFELVSTTWTRLHAAGEVNKVVYEFFTAIVFAVSTDGQHLAGVGSDGSVKLWRVDGTEIELPNNQHTGEVANLTFSNDGQYLASAGGYGDSRVKLWQVDGTEIELPNNQHTGEVANLTFSNDGQYLASAGGYGDSRVKLWRVDGTEIELPNSQHTGGVANLTFSNDGQYLASAGGYGDSRVKLWRVDGTEIELPNSQLAGGVANLTFSNDGQYLASAGGYGDGSVKLWRVDGTEIELPNSQHKEGIEHLTFSNDGQYLASAGGYGDSSVKLWRVDGTEIELPNSQLAGGVANLTFSNDDQYLASAGGYGDGSVKLWRVDGTEIELPNSQHTEGIEHLTFSNDGQYLASAGGYGDGSVKLWRVDGTEIELPNSQHTGGVANLTFSNDGQYLASADGHNGEGVARVKLWRVDGTEIKLPNSQHDRSVIHLAFSNDGRYLVSAGAMEGEGGNSHATRVKLWRVDGTEIKLPNSQHTGWIEHLTFSNDGQYLFSVGVDDFNLRASKVQLWRVEDNTINLPSVDYGSSIQAFSNDGQYLASAGEYSDSRVKLWQMIDGTEIELPNSQHTGGVGHLTFSNDGQYLASAGGYGDSRVKLWQVIDGTEIELPNSQHTGGVGHLTFSNDGQYLASAGGYGDSRVKLWQVIDGTEIELPNSQHTGGVGHLTFSNDGQYLASAGGYGDSRVKLWQVIDGTEIELPNSQLAGGVIHLTFSNDGQYLASADGHNSDSRVKIWRVDGTEIELPNSQLAGGVRHPTFSNNGQYLASAGGYGDGSVKLWRVDGTEIELSNSQLAGGIEHLTFSNDGQYLASADGHNGDSSVKLWRIDGTEIELPNSQLAEGVIHLTFSNDGQYLASADGHNGGSRVKLWRVDGIEIELPNSQRTGGIEHLTFSNDGQYLASAGGYGDSRVKLWRIDGTEIELPNSQHMGGIRHLTFSSDGQYLASADGYEGEGVARVKLWRVDGTEIELPNSPPASWIEHLTFINDGQYLASISGGVKIWNLDFKNIMQQSCQWLEFYINASSEEETEKLCSDLQTAQVTHKDLRPFLTESIDSFPLASERLSLPQAFFSLGKEFPEFSQRE